MKLYIIATFLLIALTVVLAAPIEEDSTSSSDESHDIDIRSVSDGHPGETPRLCGFPGQLGGIVGDSVCVADCQLTGYRGGHCEGDACYCD